MKHLLDGYLAFLADGSTPDDVFADDVILDMNVPSWRFQVQGVDAVRQSRLSAGGVWKVQAGAMLATDAGFVVETSYDSIEDGRPLYARSVNLVTVHDGRIAEVVHYCTGPWDAQTRARHAREAPMLAS
jgi:ketosteroid isomerase-like protein